MASLEIPTGTEIKQNKMLGDSITIKVPNTRFWVIGEKKEKALWDVYLLDPNTNRKDILRKNTNVKSFALFSNIVLKSVFPIGKKEIEFSNIKKLIIKLTKQKNG